MTGARITNDLQGSAAEFDGRLYVLSYLRADESKVTTEPVGAQRIAALGAEHAFTESGVPVTTRAHRRGIVERLSRAPVGTAVTDPVTGVVFRIEVSSPIVRIAHSEESDGESPSWASSAWS